MRDKKATYIISAHGGIISWKKMLTIPEDTSLYFYTPINNILRDDCAASIQRYFTLQRDCKKTHKKILYKKCPFAISQYPYSVLSGSNNDKYYDMSLWFEKKNFITGVVDTTVLYDDDGKCKPVKGNVIFKIKKNKNYKLNYIIKICKNHYKKNYEETYPDGLTIHVLTCLCNNTGKDVPKSAVRKYRKRYIKSQVQRAGTKKSTMTNKKVNIKGVTRNIRISSTGKKYILLNGSKHYL